MMVEQVEQVVIQAITRELNAMIEPGVTTTLWTLAEKAGKAVAEDLAKAGYVIVPRSTGNDSVMVERAARSIHDLSRYVTWNDLPNEDTSFGIGKTRRRAEARAVIAAMRDPTEAMVRAGVAATVGTADLGFEHPLLLEWRAMIDATDEC
jgi:hypothetical protein